jgi:hypothetical protein
MEPHWQDLSRFFSVLRSTFIFQFYFSSILFFVDEAGFEPTTTVLQTAALPLELFIQMLSTDFLTDILFPHYRIHLLSNNFFNRRQGS